jgi:hypothetical protein
MGQRHPDVSVFSSHHSSNTCTALAAWISTSGFPLQLDGTLQPHVHCYVDNGTELRGDFSELMAANGVKVHRATSHKHNTARTHIVENFNRQLQQIMRVNLGNAAECIRSFGLSPTAFWDYALQYAARQIKGRNILKTVDRTDAAACKTARAIADRVVPFAFGQRVSATLQLGSPHRSAAGTMGYNKQLADRAIPTLFLGVERDGRFALLTARGKIVYTIDAKATTFDPAAIVVPLSTIELAELGQALATSDVNTTVSVEPTSAAATTAPAAALTQIPTKDTESSGACAQMGSRVDVYWPAEGKSYSGTIDSTMLADAANFNIDADEATVPLPRHLRRRSTAMVSLLGRCPDYFSHHRRGCSRSR